MKKIVIVIGTVVCISGCGIYHPYQQPEVQKDNLFGQEYETVVNDSLPLGDLRWEELFTDPYLQTLIRHGLEHNTDMQITYQRIKQAEASLLTAKLAYLPSLFFSPEGSLGSFDRSAPSQTYTLPVAASWEVDLFGRLHNSRKRAKAAFLQSQEYKQAVQTQLIAGIANLYYTLLMLDAQYQISAETALAWGESVETMRAVKEAGMTTEAGVAQTEGNYYAIEASLRDLKQQINEVQNSLALLLGESPYHIERGELANQSFPEQFTTGIPLHLLANRPDVKSAELSLMQAHYATNYARSNLYPSINLSGVAGWTNSVGSAIVNPGKLLLSATASLTQPLFNRGINLAQVKIAEAQRKEAILTFRQTVLNAGAEVNDALTQYQTAKQKQVLRERQVEAFQRALESTELLMTHGSTTYLEILTARQTLLSAQLTEVADRFSEIQAIISLYHALGGGRDEIN